MITFFFESQEFILTYRKVEVVFARERYELSISVKQCFVGWIINRSRRQQIVFLKKLGKKKEYKVNKKLFIMQQ